MKNKYLFDSEFYINFYQDVKEIPIEHYMKHGKNEKRICCEDELYDVLCKNTERIKIQHEYSVDYKFQKRENKLNILIRTSMRPEHFNKCINSILEQQYSNYHIYICYDKKDSLTYLKEYIVKNKNMTIFYIKNESLEKYKFNLYNNTLMNMVEDGFILFLDDDDIFTHNMCFKIINENIIDEESILIWKFMRPDKLVYPKNTDDIYSNNLKIGEIDTTTVCFNCKYKNIAKWSDKQCGDYYFFKELFNKLIEMNALKIQKINYILTKTIYHNKSCGSI